MEVNPEVVKYFGEQKYYHGYVQEEPAAEMTRMTFLSASLTGFARWFMLFGDHARIIEPLELNTIVAGIAEALLDKLASAGKNQGEH